MGDLKPIGSEKLQGQDKIRRIMEIARFNETTPSSINETSKSDDILVVVSHPPPNIESDVGEAAELDHCGCLNFIQNSMVKFPEPNAIGAAICN